MTQSLSSKSDLDATLVNTVIKATSDVLSTMANTQVTFKEVRAEKQYQSCGDISATIGISGEHGEGMIALSFPMTLASLIVSRLLGVQVATLTSEDRADGVGELINMISGQTKTALSKNSGSTYKMTLPTTIIGINHQISSSPKNTPFLNITFDVEGQCFNLQIAFKAV